MPNRIQSDSQTGIQNSTPIPTDLGVQFGLSNSPNPYSPPQPSQPINSGQEQFPAESSQPGSLNLGQFPFEPAPVEPASPSDPQPPNFFQQASFTLKQLFTRDSDSLVAVAVGSAEGTRTPEGNRSKYFQGHTDPGNGVWNLGTFSYQHGASSAEEADVKQLRRLKQQARAMQDKAIAQGLKLTLEETLNGIDLANQAPKALLDAHGYIEWLAEAHASGLTGADAILWARVHSFLDPQTQRWNAPGLGNTAESITRDQRRRMQAISSAIAAQNDQIAADARLNPQPIGFWLSQWSLPQWSLAQRLIQTIASLLN